MTQSTTEPAARRCRSRAHDREAVGLASNGGCRGCSNAASRRRYAINRNHELARGAAYRAGHRAQEAARHDAYRRTLPGVLAASRRYRKLLGIRMEGKREQLKELDALLRQLDPLGWQILHAHDND